MFCCGGSCLPNLLGKKGYVVVVVIVVAEAAGLCSNLGLDNDVHSY